jgi:hypothetical protein
VEVLTSTGPKRGYYLQFPDSDKLDLWLNILRRRITHVSVRRVPAIPLCPVDNVVAHPFCRMRRRPSSLGTPCLTTLPRYSPALVS